MPCLFAVFGACHRSHRLCDLSHDMWNGPFGMFTHGMVRRAITNLIFYEREKEST